MKFVKRRRHELEALRGVKWEWILEGAAWSEFLPQEAGDDQRARKQAKRKEEHSKYVQWYGGFDRFLAR